MDKDKTDALCPCSAEPAIAGEKCELCHAECTEDGDVLLRSDYWHERVAERYAFACRPCHEVHTAYHLAVVTPPLMAFETPTKATSRTFASP